MIMIFQRNKICFLILAVIFAFCACAVKQDKNLSKPSSVPVKQEKNIPEQPSVSVKQNEPPSLSPENNMSEHGKTEHESEWLKLIADTYRFIENNYYKPVSLETMLAGAVKGVEQLVGNTGLLDNNNIQFVTGKVYSDRGKSRIQKITGLFIYISKSYPDHTPRDIAESLIQGMLRSLDPYCSLVPPEVSEKPSIIGQCGDPGLLITIQEGVLKVVSPIQGGSAFKAGIQAGDRIVMIDNESTEKMKLWEALKRLRGTVGTYVTISISRDNMKEIMHIKMIRDAIKVESVQSSMLKPGYAYIRVANFKDNNTSYEIEETLKKLESDDIFLKGLVLDLRDNPGGLFYQTIQVSDIFLERGVILSIKGRLRVHTKIFKADQNNHNYPVIIILINNSTSAGAEFVAAALQDNRRAVILGTPSYGKGAVQNSKWLGNGYMLNLTVAQAFTPVSDCKIEGRGVIPDLLLEESASEKISDKDVWTKKALELLYKIDEKLPLSEHSVWIKNGTLSFLFQTSELEKANVLQQQATNLYQQGAYNDAIPIAEKALAIREDILGPKHPDVATSLNNLAVFYDSLGNYEKTEALFKRALAIRKSVLWAEHPDIAESLNKLAVFYHSLGNYKKAEPLFKRVLGIQEKNFSSEHSDIAETLNNLAMTYNFLGNYEEAEPLFKRSLAIREKNLGMNHPDVAEILNNLATVYRTMGNYKKAEPLYKRVLAIYEKVFGPEHPHVAPSLNNLAGIYHSLGNYKEAEPLYKRALAIYKNAFGENHPDFAKSMNSLAELYRSAAKAKKMPKPLASKYLPKHREEKKKTDKEFYKMLTLFSDVCEIVEKNYYKPISPISLLVGAVKGIERLVGSTGLLLEKDDIKFVVSPVTGKSYDSNITRIEVLRAYAKIYEHVITYYPGYTPKNIIRASIKEIMRSLDSHCALLAPKIFEELILTPDKVDNIGLVITIQNDILKVVSPIQGSPAHKAGIRAGDRIVMIDNESAEEMELWEAMKKLEGSVGTPITLSISRDNIKEVRHIKMIRDVISSESIHSFLPEPGYGYIRITNFLERTSDDFKDALKKMESGNVSLKGLVLDLRDNPGGLLNQTIQISDIFLERGIILSINGRLKKHTKVFKASPTEKKRDYSVIALINKGSASASEILAGSLQDHNQAIILGTTSFGKGTVQTLERLRDGYGLKLTVGHYFTPNGRDVTEQGIVPDIILDEQELSEYEHFQGDLNEDAWIKKAFEILKSGLKEVSSN